MESELAVYSKTRLRTKKTRTQAVIHRQPATGTATTEQVEVAHA